MSVVQPLHLIDLDILENHFFLYYSSFICDIVYIILEYFVSDF